ncbi:MAG: hypothetical protein II919_00985 [Lachnospiraceae bacterium]|nr:hypothetical protein [Lachnospiraceae bacterium]
MSILAEALSLQLKNKEIKHSIHGDQKEGVMIAQQLPTVKIPVKILLLTDDKTNSVSLRIYGLYKMEESEITGTLFYLLNQMNSRYRWGKVVLDEQDIVITSDAIVTPFDIGEICLMLTFYCTQMADEVYTALEKLKYQL